MLPSAPFTGRRTFIKSPPVLAASRLVVLAHRSQSSALSAPGQNGPAFQSLRVEKDLYGISHKYAIRLNQFVLQDSLHTEDFGKPFTITSEYQLATQRQ